MKIVHSKAVTAFLQRCKNNLNLDSNKFLDCAVSKTNEQRIQGLMHESGYPEFCGPEHEWPSLFIKTAQFRETPYHQRIKLEQLTKAGFEFSRVELPAGRLFNVHAIQPDRERELKDWMILRALDEPYQASVLSQDGEVWMLDVPSEANTIDPYASKAHGKVLTYGLGIGYFIFMALLNPKVESITVVEQSAAVIEMFKEFLLPQFPNPECVIFVLGDAFDYFNEGYLSNFDYVFVDIWRSNDDGLMVIERLLSQYLPPFDKVDFWIESSCSELLTAMVFNYFYHLYHRRSFYTEDPWLEKLHKKINRYFAKLEIVVDEVEQLKFYMYDPQVLRNILAS